MKIILREKGKNPSLFISIISVNEVFQASGHITILQL